VRAIIGGSLALFYSYFAGAFVNLAFDPTTWTDTSRTLLVILSPFGVLIASIFAFEFRR
jgi:hypothetical protein